MRRVEYLGGRISGLESGEGSVALLVHGFPLDALMWTDQLTGLASSGRRIIAPDLRGHGRSPWLGDDINTMDLLAADMIDLVESLGGAVDLVGLSMGGYVALAMLDQAPEMIRTLGLVDTKATPDTPEGKAGRDAAAVNVVTNGRRALADGLLPKLLADGASLTVQGRVRTMIESQSYESIVADLGGMRDRPDRLSVLAEATMPVGIIVGESDVIAPPSDAEAMAAVCPTAELTVVPGAGHMAPMEAPEAVNQALEALWARSGTGD